MSDVTATVRDPQRLAALRRLVLLDTGASESFDRLVGLAARTLGAPIAMLTLIDADRQYFKAAVGLPEPLASIRETPLDYSICQYAVALGRPLIICDTRVEHWLDDNPAVRELGVTAYAGMPLVTAEGYAVGTLCVLDYTARSWSDDDVRNLEDLAAVAMREIRLHRLERRLAHQRDWRGVGEGTGR
ncbi:MAG TPA: GAF domain-containing protein [Acidimicrobiales bacterium]|jgi:GAF domain-containing protein|nr:GAF domain-containing protein [Acidimicrobiales bacterium]